MPTLQVKADVSADDLLQAVKQLSKSELEKFVRRVLAFKALSKAPSLSKDESDLLLKINRGLPPEIQARYDKLIGKRRLEILTPAEHDELLKLTDEVELFDAHRLDYLNELAKMRQTELIELLEELNIQSPGYR